MRSILFVPAVVVSAALLAFACGKSDPKKSGEPGSREEAKKDKGFLETQVGSVNRAKDVDCMNHLRAFAMEVSTNSKEMLRGKTLNGTDVPFLLMESSTLVKDPAYLYCANVHPQNSRPADDAVRLRDPSASDYEGPSNFPVNAAIFGQASRFPVLWDKEPNHVGYRFVLFLDGQVREVANRDFKAQVLDVVDSFRTGG